MFARPTSDVFGLTPDPSIAKGNPPMGSWLVSWENCRRNATSPRLETDERSGGDRPLAVSARAVTASKIQASRGLAYPSHLGYCSGWTGRDCPPRAPS